MQTKVENGVRKFETIKNTVKSFELDLGKKIETFKDRSPFATFLVELKSRFASEVSIANTDFR